MSKELNVNNRLKALKSCRDIKSGKSFAETLFDKKKGETLVPKI